MTNDNLAKKYSAEIYAKTKKYQKIYGFKIGSGKYDTWNNEADAFKHTFGAVDMALKGGMGISKFIGDYHEFDGNRKNGQPAYEENMDKWNNAVGRDIAREIRTQYNPLQVIYLINTGQMDDIIANRVMKKMKQGELITNPFKDKRSYEKKMKGYPTGYAVNINEEFDESVFDKNGNPFGKIFTAEEIGSMSSNDWQKNESYIMDQLSTFGVPREREAQKAVLDGTLIWVNSYTREDGTEVKGYYRHAR